MFGKTTHHAKNQEKMDKEKLLSSFNQQIGKTSLSERTLSEYVGAICEGVTDESLTDSFWASQKQILKTIEGQLNFDVTSKINAFKSDWEKQHPNDGKGKEKIEDFKESEAYKSLLSEIDNLKQASAQKSKDDLINGLRVGVKGKSDELKVSNKALWNDIVATISVSDEETLDTLTEKTKSMYESKLKSYMPSAVPFGSDTTKTTSVTQAEAEAKRNAFKARMIAEGRLSQEQK